MFEFPQPRDAILHYQFEVSFSPQPTSVTSQWSVPISEYSPWKFYVFRMRKLSVYSTSGPKIVTYLPPNKNTCCTETATKILRKNNSMAQFTWLMAHFSKVPDKTVGKKNPGPPLVSLVSIEVPYPCPPTCQKSHCKHSQRSLVYGIFKQANEAKKFKHATCVCVCTIHF